MRYNLYYMVCDFGTDNQGCLQCGAGHFPHRTLRCSLTKIITALHLIFAVTCAVWCGLEFSQNYNRTALHFCDHMCDTMYKMRFEVSIFFKFWAFLTQSKTNFSLFWGQVLNYCASFFFIIIIIFFGLAFLVNTC